MGEAKSQDVFDDEPGGAKANARIEDLFREHNETLLRFLRARLHSEADAREAAQEAYVRLLQLDDPGQLSFLRAYLFRIAANVATDLRRRRAVQGRVHDEIGFFERDAPATQERGLAARQQLAAVQKALAELPAKCREAFILSRREGWGSAQIAAHLGVSDRMVRIYLVRALEHLEAAL
ncbi:MAG TPA: sigma-70 family RNA polymerase sigma factor [Caulobacteraceae bacterium]|nr:sigma-70 family RNA polymerase sigma factor [Caulobacteraceae bacterium]